MTKQSFRFTITYESIVDTDTGQILETKIVERTKNKPNNIKDDGCKIPKIILSENKYQLNNAAVEMTGLHPGDKVDIRYEMHKNESRPILIRDDNEGNKVTKQYTVSLKGVKYDALSKFGNEFKLISHIENPNTFSLCALEDNKDEDIRVDTEDELDFELDELVGDKDINASFFKF